MVLLIFLSGILQEVFISGNLISFSPLQYYQIFQKGFQDLPNIYVSNAKPRKKPGSREGFFVFNILKNFNEDAA